MKVVAVDVLPGERVTVYFSAENRIDFRALVRDLCRTLVGPRRVASAHRP